MHFSAGTLPALLILSLSFSCQKSPDKQTYTDYAKAMQSYYSGALSEAEAVFSKIYSDYPDFHENSRSYANCLFYNGNHQKAVELWKKLEKEDEMNIDSMKCMASYFIHNGRTADAIPLLNTALALSSHDPMLLYQMAQCRFLEDDVQQGYSLLLSAVAEMERQVMIPLELARIYSSFGFNEEATRLVQRYSQYLDEDHPLKPALKHLEATMKNSNP
jgi:Flp pilus assembly protein TadD